MKPNEARRVLQDAIRQIIPDADFKAMAGNADLREALELDSLDFLNLIEILSHSTKINIDEKEYPKLTTMDTAVRFLCDARQSR
jgi:acyl carrier protein